MTLAAEDIVQIEKIVERRRGQVPNYELVYTFTTGAAAAGTYLHINDDGTGEHPRITPHP